VHRVVAGAACGLVRLAAADQLGAAVCAQQTNSRVSRSAARMQRLAGAPATVRSEKTDGALHRWHRPTFLVTKSACGTSSRICKQRQACLSRLSPAATPQRWRHCDYGAHALRRAAPARLSEGVPPEVAIKACDEHRFAVLVRRLRAELFQVREELGLRAEEQQRAVA
jgi:hypothetical protein